MRITGRAEIDSGRAGYVWKHSKWAMRLLEDIRLYEP
jgi:hypothetical protein